VVCEEMMGARASTTAASVCVCVCVCMCVCVCVLVCARVCSCVSGECYEKKEKQVSPKTGLSLARSRPILSESVHCQHISFLPASVHLPSLSSPPLHHADPVHARYHRLGRPLGRVPSPHGGAAGPAGAQGCEVRKGRERNRSGLETWFVLGPHPER